jgi:hypothetical protein
MPWICTGTPSGHGPRAHSPRDRHAGLVEQCAAHAGPRLSEPLRRATAEGESGVHQARGEVSHGLLRAPLERLVPDAPDVRDPLVDGRRSLAVEQVRRVDGVPAGAQLLGERAHAVGQPLHVVEQHDFGHLYTPVIQQTHPNDP